MLSLRTLQGCRRLCSSERQTPSPFGPLPQKKCLESQAAPNTERLRAAEDLKQHEACSMPSLCSSIPFHKMLQGAVGPLFLFIGKAA